MKNKNINSEIFDESIEEAKRWMALSTDAAHDIGHVKSVTKNAVRIATAMRYENIQLIKLICWWHDVGRLFGPIHEELGGQIARYNLPGHGCNEETAEIVYRAIRSHKWTMEPETIEGNIL
jgi:HD superfamily phosphodiesterase